MTVYASTLRYVLQQEMLGHCLHFLHLDDRHGSLSSNRCRECTLSRGTYAFLYALTNLLNMALATISTLVSACMLCTICLSIPLPQFTDTPH